MSFVFGNRSLSNLLTVHPDMQRLARRALELSPIDFAVVQGKRTLATQKKLYGQGRTVDQCLRTGRYTRMEAQACAAPRLPRVTNTLRSNHLSGRAIDVMPWVSGVGDWDNDGKKGYWEKISKAFKQAADDLGMEIQWGGDWQSIVDRPHFELIV